MSIFTQTLPRRNSPPFNPEAAQNSSRNPLSADASGWSWHNSLNLIPLGLIVLIALSFTLMVAQEARSASRDLAVSTHMTGQYVTATTDLALYRRDSAGSYAHAGVLFGGVTAQVIGVSADGQWLQVSCGDGSGDICWMMADTGLTMLR